MTIEFDPLALLELNDAVEYYNFKLAGLGDRFKDDVRIGINRILEYPDAWQQQTSRTRRFVLNSFPYKIIYAIQTERIIILAIANSHREPDYWVNRQRN
ncbi:type II toxin-antitoxin system RelE/ParE family toxin [Spirochaeta isovalerica]|uniref:Plasmid stabilization system protein ParE n=1 Tax=Spirochaeta isovalerica TaxID=150 RepID=A0A841RBB8_9SPIO|nr:type II toxin-antitoxin system RelE/ParE family toxin [Spirochaeta isovalerica]MBB6482694.1 plasmid stabilization system protein ParE [Spirochaeta isovalerica]